MCEHQGDELRRSNTPPRTALRSIGWMGHYLYIRLGGRSGKGPVLRRLLENGNAIEQSELNRTSGVASATISEVINKLQTEGLVVRSRSESDRRRCQLALTEAGRSQALDAVAHIHAFEEQAFSCLSDEELATFINMLTRISNHWKKLGCEEVGDAE